MTEDVTTPPRWPQLVYYGMTIVSLPLYSLVFVCLLRLRCISKTYNSTFYTILLQHCIADLLAMLLFLVFYCSIELPPIRELLFAYQSYYVTAAAYNSIYYFLYIRCTGIIFLSLQRYLIITAPSVSLFESMGRFQRTVTVVLVYWSVPTLLSIVVLKDTDFSFASLETMAIVAEQSVIKRNTLMALIVVGATCLLCSLIYAALFVFLRKHASGLSKSLRRETHLAAQVFALLLAFFVILAYYGVQNYFSQTHTTGPIYYMRALYPIANGLLSYINPFCILLLNKDLATQIGKLITWKRVTALKTSRNGHGQGVVLTVSHRAEESTTHRF